MRDSIGVQMQMANQDSLKPIRIVTGVGMVDHYIDLHHSRFLTYRSGHLAKTAGLSGISYPAMLDMILESATKRFRERQEFNLRSPQVVVHNTKS